MALRIPTRTKFEMTLFGCAVALWSAIGSLWSIFAGTELDSDADNHCSNVHPCNRMSDLTLLVFCMRFIIPFCLVSWMGMHHIKRLCSKQESDLLKTDPQEGERSYGALRVAGEFALVSTNQPATEKWQQWKEKLTLKLEKLKNLKNKEILELVLSLSVCFELITSGIAAIYLWADNVGDEWRDYECSQCMVVYSHANMFFVLAPHCFCAFVWGLWSSSMHHHAEKEHHDARQGFTWFKG